MHKLQWKTHRRDNTELGYHSLISCEQHGMAHSSGEVSIKRNRLVMGGHPHLKHGRVAETSGDRL